MTRVNSCVKIICLLKWRFFYRDPKDMRNSLKYDISSNPGKNMMQCLKFALQTKLHQLFLDPKINSMQTVATNVRECFTYFIRRMDAMVSELPPGKSCFFQPRTLSELHNDCILVLGIDLFHGDV